MPRLCGVFVFFWCAEYADRLYVKTSRDNVTGSLLSDKIFVTDTDSGKINLPKTADGGRCDISTDTGDIEIKIN